MCVRLHSPSLTTVCVCVCAQVFLTNSANVFLLEPCQDVPKLLDNQVEVCKGVLSIYRHMIMEHPMNTQTWSVCPLDPPSPPHPTPASHCGAHVMHVSTVYAAVKTARQAAVA